MTGWEHFRSELMLKNRKFTDLRQHIEQTLKSREERLVNRLSMEGTLTEAAVLLPLVVPKYIWEGGEIDGLITDHIYLLLEKRSSQMNKNPGDMAFAGGRVDEEDSDLLATAFREANEEIGIEEDSLHYIACMDEFVSTSRYIVRTVVCWLVTEVESNDFRKGVEELYKPRTDETEYTVAVKLTHLLNPYNYSNVKYDLKTNLTSSNVGYIRYFDIHDFLHKTKIWGLTASMIRRLIDIIFPNNILPEEPTI